MIKASAAVLLALAAMAAHAEEEFKFDASEFDKKPYEFGGYVELKSETLNLRPTSSAFLQRYYGENGHDWLQRGTATVELTGKYNLGDFTADARGRAQVSHDIESTDKDYDKLMEGGLRWSPAKEFTLDAGKRVQRWGRGYAWSPVGLIERAKDPNDPLASREGYVMIDADWLKSFSSGPVQSLGLTVAAVPQRDRINTDFGRGEHSNPAAKLYLLAWDTDIDLVWLGQGSRPQSFGFDFSRNLGSALEIHGEWARSFDAQRMVIDANGTPVTTLENRNSYLLGMRYLSQNEITWIAEYYRNGAGYSQDQLENYHRFIDTALGGSGTPGQIARAQNLAQSAYSRSNSGRDYLYLRASKNEPLGWLYTSASITAIANANDGSFQISPEFVYSGITNLEIRTKLIWLSEKQYSDFGEKLSRQRLEITGKYSF
jgi:hypothetical protein